MPENPLVDWLRDGEPGPLDDEPTTRRGRRVPGLLAVLGGLWLGLLVVAGQVLGAPAAAPPPAPDPAAPPPAPGASTPAHDPAGAGRDERAVAAHAVLAVRAGTTAGPAEGGPRRYVDIAVAEEIRWVGDLAVATVLAYVLEGDEQRWSSARTARYGVALSTDGGSMTAEAVWPLPAPEPGEPRSWDRLDGTALAKAARAALEAAGYRDVGDLDLAAHPALTGVLRVTINATAPGETDTSTHHVWLDGAAAGVLGWRG